MGRADVVRPMTARAYTMLWHIFACEHLPSVLRSPMILLILLLCLRKPSFCSVARLLDASGLGNGAQFIANWEAVWQGNLERCSRRGKCMIQLS